MVREPEQSGHTVGELQWGFPEGQQSPLEDAWTLFGRPVWVLQAKTESLGVWTKA